MAGIFISYRRSDSEGEAGRLADDLVRRFGESQVFMDVDTIQPGRDFRKAIDESIRSCKVLLAIIGPDWFGATGGNGEQRLLEAGDYVRLEIASALHRDIAVIPVMVRGARMPVAETLPPDLKELAYRNAVELTHMRWRSDIQFLSDALRPQLHLEAPESHPPGQASLRQPNSADVVSQPQAEGSPAALGPVLLQQVGRELARFIGPIASVVVKRAARSCNTSAELVEKVAAEIDTPKERAAFIVSMSR